MTAESFNRALRAFQKRKPFSSFMVALINGDRFEVKHPESLVFQNGTAVYIAPDDEIRIFDNEGVNEISAKRRASRS